MPFNDSPPPPSPAGRTPGRKWPTEAAGTSRGGGGGGGSSSSSSMQRSLFPGGSSGGGGTGGGGIVGGIGSTGYTASSSFCLGGGRPPAATSAANLGSMPSPSQMSSSMQRSSSVSSTLAHAGGDGNASDIGSVGSSSMLFAAASGMDPMDGLYRRQKARNIATTSCGLSYVRSPLSSRRKRLPPRDTSNRDISSALFQSSLSLANAPTTASETGSSSTSPCTMATSTRFNIGRRIDFESTNAVIDLERDRDSDISFGGGTSRANEPSAPSTAMPGVLKDEDSRSPLLSESKVLQLSVHAAPASACDTSTTSSSSTSRPGTTSRPSIWQHQHQHQQEKKCGEVNRAGQRWITGTVSFDNITSKMKSSRNDEKIQQQKHEDGRTTELPGRTGLASAIMKAVRAPPTSLSPRAERIGSATTAIMARTLSRDDDELNVADHQVKPIERLGNAATAILARTISRDEECQTETIGPLDTVPSAHVSKSKFSPVPLQRWDDCILVRAEGGRTGCLMITSTHLIFEFDDFDDEVEKGEHSDADVQISANDFESGFLSNSEDDTVTSPDTTINNHLVLPSIDDPDRPDQALCDIMNTANNNAEELEPEEVRLMRIRQRRRRGDERSSTSSSASSYSARIYSSDESSTGTRTPADIEHNVRDSSCDETYEEEMNDTLIRAIQEEARRRLQELDEEEDETTSRIGSAASSSLYFAHQQDFGRWARGLPRRSECEPGYEDNDNESDVSGFDEDRLIAWRRQAKALALAEEKNRANAECSGVGRYECASESNGLPPPSVESDEELRFYTLGPDRIEQESRYRGVKFRLSKLGEIYPRRFMMRDIAFEIFAPSPSSSSASGGTTNGLQDTDEVLTGELSKTSFYIAMPTLDATSRCRSRQEKARRDDVVQKLRESAHRLNFSYWQTGAQGSGAGRWNPASIFKRRGANQTPNNGGGKTTDPLHTLTRAWRKGNISNFDYLCRLNAVAGRSRHDPSHYPVFPWVLCNYTSETVPDLSDDFNYRDLSKPVGALDPERLENTMGKYMSLCSAVDSAIPPFMYGSHYSSAAGVPLYFLVRTRPFAGLHRQLQGGTFDVADRLFRSVPMTYDLCSRSGSEVKELTPEWYSDPSFLTNCNGFNFGTCVNGEEVDDVILPPWAHGSPQKFIEVMRNALESDVCSQMLPSWIDLIFGMKQKGSEARKAYNLFYHLTYYEAEDLAKIEDDELRTETELHIADFGHCPAQLFPHRPHPHKKLADCVAESRSELRRIAAAATPTSELALNRHSAGRSRGRRHTHHTHRIHEELQNAQKVNA